MQQQIEYMNSPEMCIKCFKPPEKGYSLIKHHVTYFPEKIAFVHHHCHQEIHDPINPMTSLIQYQEGDPRRFYKNREDRLKKSKKTELEGRIIGL